MDDADTMIVAPGSLRAIQLYYYYYGGMLCACILCHGTPARVYSIGSIPWYGYQDGISKTQGYSTGIYIDYIYS